MNIYDHYRILDVLDNKVIMTKINTNTYLILYTFDVLYPLYNYDIVYTLDTLETFALCKLSKRYVEYLYDPDFWRKEYDLIMTYTDKYYNQVSIIFNKDVNKMVNNINKITQICGHDIKIDYDILCEIYNININYNFDFKLLINKDVFYSSLYHKIFQCLTFDLVMDVKLLIIKLLINHYIDK